MKSRSNLLCLALLFFAYLSILTPFVSYMAGKPYVEKLGIVPRPELLQVVCGDQKQLAAASIIGKVILYFGGLMEKEQAKLTIPPDYPAMSRTLHAALKLDPYNMDGYYFAQSILVWDVKQYKIANALLDYGMKYRTWDWYLPFFAGFNYAYFLNDYQNAAQMYMRAGELSGNPLFQTLASRYLQQAGKTDIAIAYLAMMEKGARNAGIRKSFDVRLHAFEELHLIEKARDRFQADRGILPRGIEDLLSAGYLNRRPVDPYGGIFYLEPDGTVTSTSKFSFAGAKHPATKEH